MAKTAKPKKVLVRRLEREVKRTSLSKVARELGYKSHNTIARWIELNSIPERMIVQVKEFLGRAL